MSQPDSTQISWHRLKQDRLERTFAFMSELNLDILIAVSTDSIQNRGNVRFLTNYSTAFGSSLVVLSRQGEPILLVPAGSFQLGWAQNMAWVTDIRAVQDFVAATVSVLNELGEAQARVGLVGFENLPGSTESQLSALLPTRRFVQVSDSFRLMKSVKTADEIELVRRSVTLADSALEDLASAIRVGLSERDLFARAEYQVILAGGEDCFLLASSGPQAVVMPMPAERSLQARDVVRFSIEPAAGGGFWTQTIRVFALGDPSLEIQATFELCAEALAQAEEKLKPGLTGGDLAKGMIEILGRADGGQIGPLGHGMGLDLTEPPFMLPADETVIQPGMVIAIHPYLTWGEASIWLGDTFLVTEDGSERLTKISNDLLTK